MKFYLLDKLDWKAKAKVRNLKFRSRLRNTTKGCDDSLRSHCFLLTLAPFLMKVKHRRSRLLPKLFVTILNPSVQPKIQMTLSPVFFFRAHFLLFFSTQKKRENERRDESHSDRPKKRRKILFFQCLADHHFWSPFLSFLCIGNTNCTKAFWGKYVWQKSLESSIF